MDVSIIVVSYNVREFLKRCIESTLKHTAGIEWEMIVVDNASKDGTPQWLKTVKNKKIKVVLSEDNLGFCRGNNMGLVNASGKYILLLNPDTQLKENAVGKMFDWMEKHPRVGVSSCRLIDGEGRLLPTGGFAPTLGRLLSWGLFIDDIPGLSKHVSSYHPKTDLYRREFELDWVTGAFFMVRKTAVEQAGVMDENIFLYADELEWAIRIKNAGWQIMYTPITEVVHLERKSSAGVPINAVTGEIRGLRYIYRKHFPLKANVANLILNVTAVLRAALWLARLNPAVSLAYLKTINLGWL